MLTLQEITKKFQKMGYGKLHRLDSVLMGTPGTLQTGTTYTANGNIASKTGLGQYTYGTANPGPHALVQVQNSGNLLNTRAQAIGYNAFNKALWLTDSVNTDACRLDITYGPDNQRWKTVLKKNSTVTRTVLYAGNYERVTEGGVTRELCYLPGGIVYVKQAGQTDKIYYSHKDHLGSFVKLTDGNGAAVFAATYDAWGKQTVTTSTFKFHRGFTGHEHLPEFGLINMNGRMYDPVLGRFLSPDPYVQAPDFSQSFNRYSYCLNNPLIYTDPDGEVWWLIPVIAAAVFGTGNLAAHAIRGDVNNFWDGLKYFGQGAVTGFALGCVWQFAPLIPYVGQGIQTTMTVYTYMQGITGAAGMIGGAINDGWDGLGRAGKLFLGNFYLNEKEPWLGMWQGFTRHTWEMPQSWLGHTVSQVANTAGITEKVEYWGGATFSTNTEQFMAVSIGNYINAQTVPYSNFDEYILTDYTLMHEYGHTFSSRRWGPLYLPAIGAPSFFSAMFSDDVTTMFNGRPLTLSEHRFRWYERAANKHARKYFRKYGVEWDERNHPTKDRR